MNYVIYDTKLEQYVATLSQSHIVFSESHPITFENESEADMTKLFIKTNFSIKTYDALEVRPHNENTKIQTVGSGEA